jgi:hypothetical protein
VNRSIFEGAAGLAAIAATAIAAIASCGGAKAVDAPPAPSARIAIPEAAPPPSASAPPAASAPALAIDAVEAPRDARCTWSTERSTDAYVLRAKPGGASFARAEAPRVRAKLLGEGGLFVELTSSDYRARGFVDATDVRSLRPARAITFGGFVIATPNARLKMAQAADASVAVALPPVDEIVLTTNEPTTLTCADIGIARAEFDPHATLPKPLAGAFVMPDRFVPLAMTPGGAPVAKIAGASAEIEVLERRGAHARVVVELGDRMVVGWIAAADVRAKLKASSQEELKIQMLGALGSGLGASAELRGGATRADQVGGCKPRWCASEVRLVAEVGGSRWVIGSLASEASFCALGTDDAFTRVQPPASLRLSPDAKLLVPTSDLAPCSQ